MRVRRSSILLLACCATILCSQAKAQTQSVKILKIEIDGKEVKQDFKVLLYANGSVIEPMRVENSFLVPVEVKNCKTVSVRFLFGDYNLFFDSVYLAKFETDWIVGVDKKPFDQEYVPRKEARKFKFVYYLQFVSHQGDDTVMVVKVHK